MDFSFDVQEIAFIKEVRAFLSEEEHGEDAGDVLALNRHPSQLADTAARRRFNRRMAERGYLGMSWPKEYGGQEKSGVYEYLLNEELASRGAAQTGKGVGCIGQTLIRHGSDFLKSQFLPKILNAEIEFALGYTEPSAGSDLASLRLRAVQDGNEWVLNGQKMFTTSAHFADWYWVAARTDPEAPKHKGISLFLIPLTHPGLTIHPIQTIGSERTNTVFFDNVRVHEDYIVGEANKGWTYICEALDIERFTLFTISPLLNKFDILLQIAKATTRDGIPLSEIPDNRRELARLATDVETARMLQRRVIAAAAKGEVPAVEAAMFKLFSTELVVRMVNSAMDMVGPDALLSDATNSVSSTGALLEFGYRSTVIDTIGGGSSEVQRNIIAKRGLGLPLQ